jgi:ribosomal protein S18 acetylase RimI-like enzyme
MGAHFADHRPDDHGTGIPVEVEPLTAPLIEACAALAVERDGGRPSDWRASLERNLGAEDRATFVARTGDDVAGYGTVGWFAPRTSDPTSPAPDGWYLLGLLVAPRYRRRGVGRALTAARLRWVAGRGDRVWYFASSANPASIDLHTGFGFRLVDAPVEVPGVTFTATGQLYALDLPAPASAIGPIAP